jgi:hypothetical protein
MVGAFNAIKSRDESDRLRRDGGALPQLRSARRRPRPRWFAVLQVVLTCGIPTQLIAAIVLAVAAHVPLEGNGRYFVGIFASSA